MHIGLVCSHFHFDHKSGANEAQKHEEEESSETCAHRVDLRLVLKVYADAHLHLWFWLSICEHCVEVLHKCLAEDEDLVCEFAHFSLHGVDAHEAVVFAVTSP